MKKLDGKKNPERIAAAKAGRAKGFSAYRKTSLTYAHPMEEPFAVDTIEGVHTGKAGDYLAIGAHGEMYPIDKDVFEATYEPVYTSQTRHPDMEP